MKYEFIVASDLDGTLLAGSDSVSPENEAAIKTMSNRGVCFVPCSGRTFFEMPKCVRENENIRYYIGSDGAAVWDKKEGKIIDRAMDQRSLAPVLDLLDKYETLSTVRSEAWSYVDREKNNARSYEYYGLSKAYGSFISYYVLSRENFSEFVRGLDRVEMICTFFKHEDELKKCSEEIMALGGFKITSSEKGNIEIMRDTAGKGNALLALADYLGVSHDKTIGVGDSRNDMDLIRKAGISLAMENACDEVKMAADFITSSNDDDGVARAIYEFIR